MTAKRWFIVEHTVAALLLVVAFATACGKPSEPTAQPSNVEDVTGKVSVGAAFYSLKTVRVKIDGGYLYVTTTGKGGVAQTFIPDGK